MSEARWINNPGIVPGRSISLRSSCSNTYNDAGGLDALHTQDQTARELVLEHGADFLLTVEDNQPTVRANIEKRVPAPPALFPPPETTENLAGSREFNKGQLEVRVLRCRPASSMPVNGRRTTAPPGASKTACICVWTSAIGTTSAACASPNPCG